LTGSHHIIVVFGFGLDVLVHVQSSIDKSFLWQKCFEDGFSIREVNSMQVLSLYLLLGHNLHTVEHAQLGDVE